MDSDAIELGFTIDADYVANQQAFMEDEAPIQVNVWLESLDDTRVWAPLFDNLPQFHFTFLNAASFKSDDGKSANGCSRLLKLLDSKQITLGKNQIFCLDSDFKFISSLCSISESKKYDSEHIYWTLVHSKENIHMFPSLVNETISHMTGIPKLQLAQQAEDIFGQFSSDIFTSLSAIIFLDCLNDKSPQIDLTQFKSKFLESASHLKKIPYTPKIDFENQESWIKFKDQQASLNLELNTIIENMSLQNTFMAYLENLASYGINQFNIHLFMRGHDLEDVMCKIFGLICEAYKQQAITEIQNSSKSTEIKQQRIKEFMGSWIGFRNCFKARTPNFEQIPFFSDNIQAIRNSYST